MEHVVKHTVCVTKAAGCPPAPEWLSLLIWSRNTEAYPEKDANEGTASSKISVTFVLCANFYSPPPAFPPTMSCYLAS